MKILYCGTRAVTVFASKRREADLQREWWKSGMAGVVGVALATIAMHLATGWRYGFNRDELMALEDARHLAWGYVQYPPMTAFFGWLALKLFGTSLVGFRFFAALVQAVALVLTGLMAREMGGGKWAQMTAALAGVPFCLGGGALMQYISFDYVCWVLVTYAMVRVLKSENGNCRLENEESEVRKSRFENRNGAWWLVVGAGIGLGMMAKYTMGLLVAGVLVGVLATGARRWLKSGWLWAGVAVAVVMFLPNVFWEWRHGFESIAFLRFLHERDVATGVTDGFFVGQLELTILALPLVLAGLWFCFVGEQKAPASEGGCYTGRYAALGWMYLVPLVLLVAMKGRDYYLAPAYPMLYAAGSVWAERQIGSNEALKERESSFNAAWVRRTVWMVLLLDVVVAVAVALPIAPVNSRWWKEASRKDIAFPEEIGWEEFTQTVAQVWNGLPAGEKAHAAIMAGNYGEVGALNLYGGRWGLPKAISGVNSSWERGYGDVSPQTVVVVGYPQEFLERYFESCQEGGRVWNKFGVANEETIEDPVIFVCRGLRGNWEEFWRAARKFA